ncbi:MAG: HD domain-containing protein [Methanocalculaceae archaeon]|nr:HD domain-containing protein [Methanocalculaceae archaeon]
MHNAASLLTEDFRHADQVCRLSLAIYDDLSFVHNCGRQTRRLLTAAALLHDIGWSISNVSHHKTGMAFIAGDRTLPFSLRERTLVALAVRYHRGRCPNGVTSSTAAFPNRTAARFI